MCYDYTGKSAPYRAKFWEPRSTALYPNPRYNEVRYNKGRLYVAITHRINIALNNIKIGRACSLQVCLIIRYAFNIL